MEILLMIRLQTWIYTILAIVYFITIISCIVVVLSENRNPIKSLAWVTVLFFLPVAGLVFYLFFGRNPKAGTVSAGTTNANSCTGWPCVLCRRHSSTSTTSTARL